MKICVAPVDAAGHFNPLLALCTKLRDMGHDVKFFLGTEMNEEHLLKLGFEAHVYGERGKPLSAARIFEDIPSYDEQDETDSKYLIFIFTFILNFHFILTFRFLSLSLSEELISDTFLWGYKKLLDWLPKFIDKVKEFQPDLIIHDQTVSSAPITAFLEDIPCVSLITVSSLSHPHPLLFPIDFQPQHHNANKAKQTESNLFLYFKVAWVQLLPSSYGAA